MAGAGQATVPQTGKAALGIPKADALCGPDSILRCLRSLASCQNRSIAGPAIGRSVGNVVTSTILSHIEVLLYVRLRPPGVKVSIA